MNLHKINDKFLSAFYLITFLLAVHLVISKFIVEDSPPEKEPEPEIVPVTNEFGLITDTLISSTDYVNTNETLSDILLEWNVTPQTIATLCEIPTDDFDITKIISGKPYHTYYSEKENKLHYFVYEKDPVNYVVIDLIDSVRLYTDKKEVVKKTKIASGIIEHSLYTALTKNDISPELVLKLSEIFAWQIDFYHIQKGDNFKVIFEEKYADDKPVGIGEIIGAYFSHYGEDYYAVQFDQGNGVEYFDENGKSLRKAFLKAPLKYSRISSRYNPKRFHPVLKRFKAHLGTDYAAPAGTPIYSVGDGVVIEAGYTGGNGNYVKIRHNSVYTTQYLHMSKFAKGIRKGVSVKQGDVIGYVGSTGLATGPHVCFRFWKNGQQVDPLREKIPPSTPVKPEYSELYETRKNLIIGQLNEIKLHPGEGSGKLANL